MGLILRLGGVYETRGDSLLIVFYLRKCTLFSVDQGERRSDWAAKVVGERNGCHNSAFVLRRPRCSFYFLFFLFRGSV